MGFRLQGVYIVLMEKMMATNVYGLGFGVWSLGLLLLLSLLAVLMRTVSTIYYGYHCCVCYVHIVNTCSFTGGCMRMVVLIPLPTFP